MNSRGYMQPYATNPQAIRQEIQRFESVHPSIYAIYDLIESIPDPLIQQQIREHVVCIEGKWIYVTQLHRSMITEYVRRNGKCTFIVFSSRHP